MDTVSNDTPTRTLFFILRRAVFFLLSSSYVEFGKSVHASSSEEKGNDQSYVGDSKPAMPYPSNLHHSQWRIRIAVQGCAFGFIALWKLMLVTLVVLAPVAAQPVPAAAHGPSQQRQTTCVVQLLAHTKP
jgi:hypothetical protein